jgi:predicted ArsR family transcriptional regulator
MLGWSRDRDLPAMDLPLLLRGTKGRIVKLLRRGEQTVDDLATPLELTPNAVRAHLAELERDGLVQQRSVRRGPRKPSYGFSLTEGGEALFPRRYDQVLNAVLADLRGRRGRRGQGDREDSGPALDSAAIEALFRRLGQNLAAQQAPRFAALAPEARYGEALRFLRELGGEAALEAERRQENREENGGESRDGGAAVIVGQSCPFKAVVPEHPEICTLLESFLEGVLPGAQVHECCEKGGAPRCRFEVSLPIV